MVTSIKTPAMAFIICACMAFFVQSCEMKEETKLNPEIVITEPENEKDILNGARIRIKARLKDFSQYQEVHQITLKAGDSILVKKEEYVPFLNCFLNTKYLSGTSALKISARVNYTDNTPEDKNWNYFSVRDHYEKYVEKGNNDQGPDTLKANTSVTVNLTGHPGSSISMDFVSFSPDTMAVNNKSLKVGSFQMGKYEVTNHQYCQFLNSIGVDSSGYYGGIRYIFITGSNGISFDGDKFTCPNGWESLPVVNVTWTGANNFCKWMGGRLPTREEWYYATDPAYDYSGSNSADHVAWYKANSNSQLHAVGLKAPNTYGIYDMSGNAAEWCLNWYNESCKEYRGGHWDSNSDDLLTSQRFHMPPEKAGNYLGFRVVIPE